MRQKNSHKKATGWRFLTGLILIIAGLQMTQSAQAQVIRFSFPPVDWKTGWAAGIKAGSTGPGFEVVKSVNSNWNARLGFSYLPFSFNRTLEVTNMGLAVSAKNRLGGINFQGDFFFRPWFYFTGGLMVNLTHSDIGISLTDTIHFGEISITPEEVGTLTAGVSPAWTVAPLLGIGFGNSFPGKSRFGYHIELGAVYLGGPRVRLDASGMILPTASLLNEVALESAFKGYQFFPVVSAQVSYRIR